MSDKTYEILGLVLHGIKAFAKGVFYGLIIAACLKIILFL